MRIRAIHLAGQRTTTSLGDVCFDGNGEAAVTTAEYTEIWSQIPGVIALGEDLDARTPEPAAPQTTETDGESETAAAEVEASAVAVTKTVRRKK